MLLSIYKGKLKTSASLRKNTYSEFHCNDHFPKQLIFMCKNVLEAMEIVQSVCKNPLPTNCYYFPLLQP